MATAASPTAQLRAFLAKFSPEIAARAQAILKKMRARYPSALELVYDNYNALAIGFGPTERASEVIFSIAIYPNWINLFFLQGKTPARPEKDSAGQRQPGPPHPPDFAGNARRTRDRRLDGNCNNPRQSSLRPCRQASPHHPRGQRQTAPAPSCEGRIDSARPQIRQILMARPFCSTGRASLSPEEPASSP